MKLLQDLLSLSQVSAHVSEDLVTEGSGYLARPIENWMDERKMYSMEGMRGIRNFTALVGALGYNSLNEFLEDNSGALDAMVEWLGTQRNPDWAKALAPYSADSED